MKNDTPFVIGALLGIATSAALAVLCITGYVVTIEASNWLLLIAEAILPPVATVHGLGHFVGFWP